MALTDEELAVKWMEGRSRPNQIRLQSTDHKHFRDRNFAPKPGNVVDAKHINVKVGECPCATCGHIYMHQCEPKDGGRGCLCCSGFCT